MYFVTSGDQQLVAQWMHTMDASGKLSLPQPWVARLQQEFGSARVEDAQMLSTISDTFKR